MKTNIYQLVNKYIDDKFSRYISEDKRLLEDFYTSYINKIGLNSNGEFILNSNDAVLDFSFKDCYLYGG
ncbi:hypothetical protein [Mycoplasma feriruminatoris]|uniref:Uncharacterized protein n=1 Tax=Mycoplasma feriruminatoris TaxID=1179777 RepID=A0AAQ3HY81_9MOLU|nr:hypothetical protein [Mycoplasma feriruminatoris]WFQ95503.1 hypothetical protein MFERI15407_00764 [Mycoplasma feriruminatoris]